MRITDEQKERAAFVNLPQFLMAHGFDLKKVGREYVWKDHDSLHIKDNTVEEMRGSQFQENISDRVSFWNLNTRYSRMNIKIPYYCTDITAFIKFVYSKPSPSV